MSEKESIKEPKAEKKGRKPSVKPEKFDPMSVSQSTKKVIFECTKDSGAMKAGSSYPVSENLAEILEVKGLGKKKA